MRKKPRFIYVLLFISAASFLSCNQIKSPDNNSTNKDSNTLANSTDTEKIATNYSVNTLNWLYIEKARFHRWWTDHPTKTMYRFTFSSNKITLTGWAPDRKNDDNDDYDKADLLKLKACAETETLKGSRLYLGNIKLSRNNNKAIDDLLIGTPSARYVLFKPVNYDSDNDHIGYEIYLSTTPSPGGILPSLHAIAKADPSPPASRR